MKQLVGESGTIVGRARSPLHLIGGRYEVVRRIGSGGMAEVYLALDLLLEREVVVKMLLREFRNDPTAVERFRREGVALATVHSPHVLCVHDIGMHERDMYLVVRYVCGHNLEELITQQGPMPTRRAAMLVSQVLVALDALHERRLVHRDVKPSNVLVEGDDHVVLIDLGVVQNPRHSTLTPESDTAGTPRFMAPEQRRYHVVDLRADLYQAGLLLLHLLTGVDAYALQSDPAQLFRLCDGLDEAIGALIRRALADSPVDRFLSAGEMRHAIERALEASVEDHWGPHENVGALGSSMYEVTRLTARQRRFPRGSSAVPNAVTVPPPRPTMRLLLVLLVLGLGLNALLLELRW